MNSAGPSAGRPYYYKLFRVKRDDGRVTTLSVDPVLVTQAVRLAGGLKPVGKFRVEEFEVATARGVGWRSGPVVLSI